MAKKFEITQAEREFVQINGGGWNCDSKTMAAALNINASRAARVVMQMRGEQVHADAAAREQIQTQAEAQAQAAAEAAAAEEKRLNPPATPKQVAYLVSLGVDVEFSTLTKETASLLIDAAKNGDLGSFGVFYRDGSN